MTYRIFLFLPLLLLLHFSLFSQEKNDKIIKFEEKMDGLYGKTTNGEWIKIFDKGKDKAKEILADANEMGTDLRQTSKIFFIGSGLMVTGAVLTTSGILISDKTRIDTTAVITVNGAKIPITTTEIYTPVSKKVMLSLGVVTGFAGLGLNVFAFYKLVNNLKKASGIPLGRSSSLDLNFAPGYASAKITF